MKTTVVPAQVTTVEDKIAGNLNFTQLLLLTLPVFLSGAIFAFLPPLMNFSSYKLIICASLVFVCMTMAIRIKGRILLQWITVIARYNLRSRYYVFNKNSSYLRNILDKDSKQAAKPKTVKEYSYQSTPAQNISTPELVRLETAVADPRSNFHLRVGKGGLRVYIKEVK